MSDTNITPYLDPNQIPNDIQKYDDSVLNAVANAGGFLPRLQLMIANAEKCKKGEFQINHYALVRGSEFVDLGKEVDVFCFTLRPKALEMGEATICVYDPKIQNGKPTGEFARIAAKSEQPNSGCMFGLEFLVWIPSQKTFATFFMGSKSARRESANMKARLRNAATLKSHLIETKSFSWFSPLITPCSTPFEMPTQDEFAEVVSKFNNPPESEIERDEAPAAGGRVV